MWLPFAVTQGTKVRPHMSLHQLLLAQAECIPDAPAILAPGRNPLTYSRPHRHVENMVRTLQTMGVSRHDRVALVLPNSAEMAVAFLAVAAAATCAPLNPAYHADEFDLCLATLHAKALVVQAGMDSPARDVACALGVQIIELSPMLDAEAGLFMLTGEEHMRAASHEFTRPYDVGLALYTAGTTSRSKFVPLTHMNLCASAYNIRAALGLVASDRCLNVMPLFHGHGLKGMVLPSLVAGGSVMCTSAFSAVKFFDWMAECQPT
jgi:acyl-CoA synthetase (AMP-forming)/AMP-acid ligase II